MKQKKYGVALIGVVFCALLITAAAMVSPTQARYENTVSWQGVYAPGRTTLTSNYLTENGPIVLLKPWQVEAGSSRMEEITVAVAGGSTDATVTCSTESPYIQPSLDNNIIQVNKNGHIIKLRLTLTEAVAQLKNAVQATVRVEVQSVDAPQPVFADFQVMLYPKGQQPEYTQGSEQQANITVDTHQEDIAFAWDEKTVLSFVVQDNADVLELMYNGDDFPEGTRYAYSQQEYILGDSMAIRFPVTEGISVPLCLDFSGADTLPVQLITMSAEAYLGNTATGRIDFQLPVTAKSVTFSLDGTQPIIKGNGTLTVPVTGDASAFNWQIERMITTETGLEFVAVEDAPALTLQTLEDGTNSIVLSNSNGDALAGTYRLTLTKQWQGKILAQHRLLFFIHY